MRRASLTFFSVASLAAAVLVPLACATQVEDPNAASGSVGGGGGGTATSTSTSSSTSTGSGPCVGAADCAAFTDACNVGTCINGACEKVPAGEGASCDDGKQCTQGDHCQAGACTGALKPCTSSNPCAVGVCDLVTDSCTEMPGNDGASCVDADPCTLTAFCSGGVCSPGQEVDCSFLDGVCAEGVCDPQLGCVASPLNDGAPCNDGFYCTIADACQGGVCQGQPNTCAAPGDVCMVGSCNENTDTCVAVPGNDGGACDDENACTGGETCAGGACSGGQPANAGGPCAAHDACTPGATCNAGGTCVGSAPITQCIDGDGCCPAACDLATDADCVPACCGDEQNPFPPANNCSQGAVWIAWEYVPGCSFNMTRLEIHTDPGNVALLADANDAPGAVIFQGPLGAPDAQGWRGADVVPPKPLVGGQKYWIAENVGQCSTTSAGTAQPYYGSFGNLSGPWDGPFQGGNIWTSHVIGECP